MCPLRAGRRGSNGEGGGGGRTGTVGWRQWQGQGRCGACARVTGMASSFAHQQQIRRHFGHGGRDAALGTMPQHGRPSLLMRLPCFEFVLRGRWCGSACVHVCIRTRSKVRWVGESGGRREAAGVWLLRSMFRGSKHEQEPAGSRRKSWEVVGSRKEVVRKSWQ